MLHLYLQLLLFLHLICTIFITYFSDVVMWLARRLLVVPIHSTTRTECQSQTPPTTENICFSTLDLPIVPTSVPMKLIS
jgi:hypothetical protein